MYPAISGLITALCAVSQAFCTENKPCTKTPLTPSQSIIVEKTVPADAGTKPAMTISHGDAKLTLGAKTKIEHYYQDNAVLLNKNIPDENEYFKHSVDLIFDFAYGEKKYGHKAVQLYSDLKHKSVWGKPASYADKEGGPAGPASVKLANSIFGAHSHTTGKPLTWFTEAWLQFSFNAICDSSCENRHYLKLGWFPFELGRGIALGSYYGAAKEILGLYSYPEDKAAPGINLHGDIIKDRLSYDIYYARFEERNKSFSDTINYEKRHWIGRSTNPWRGVNKDDSLIAARLKIYPLPEVVPGILELEPYWFYNDASDQKLEIAPDVKTRLHTFGFATEYAYSDLFEFGSDSAFNFGTELVRSIDRNVAQIENRNGQLVEVYSHIVDTANSKVKALVTPDVKTVALNQSLSTNNQPLIANYKNSSSRVRPSYCNKLRGWMTVVDATGHIPCAKLSLSAAYGYASGDANPHDKEENKTYKGFIGLHEWYSGKRVKSLFLLDQRLLKRPTSLSAQDSSADEDMTFSDLHHAGVNLLWKPKIGDHQLSFSPNVLFFWKDHKSLKFDQATNAASAIPCDFASSFMGTEANIIATVSLVKDLTLFAVFAGFFPGSYFKDISGVELGNDYIKRIQQENPDNSNINPADFRIKNDRALHMNIGFTYKF